MIVGNAIALGYRPAQPLLAAFSAVFLAPVGRARGASTRRTRGRRRVPRRPAVELLGRDLDDCHHHGYTPQGKILLMGCHKRVSSWVFFSKTGEYTLLFYDDTRVAMLLTVERIVGDNPRNVCRKKRGDNYGTANH